MTEDHHDGNLPPITGPGVEAAPDDSVPEVEGYEVTGKLGQGGMGTVWSAVQLTTRRQVALKVFGRGAFTSEKDRARFEREVELTARLQHRNIARLYESSLRQGVHYYAMELIDGTSLDQYAEEHCLTQRQMLELMGTVCRAVQHAHERGVIHRDLKPSNILVTRDGQPHILDFGLAKIFLKRDSGLPISTDGEAVGTPPYMSPEQASGHVNEIDTRTDVYALGVILFRLLTGESPHDLSGTRYEVLRRIVEEEVKRPREITNEVDRELDALIVKALSHDPKDRYPSAGALAQDIENYLTDEPLSAKRPSTAYFLWKRVKKYRVRVAIAASVLAILLGMAVFAYARVAEERTKAVEERGKAEAARDRAEKQADRAKATYESLQSMLGRVDPPGAWGAEIILHESLPSSEEDISRRYSEDDIRTKLGDQPEAEAAVRMTTGCIYLALDEVNSAEMQFSHALETRRRVLGREHPQTLKSMVNLAVALARKGKLDLAEPMLRHAIEIQRRVLGEEHPEALAAMNNLGIVLQKWGKLDNAEKVLRKCLEIERRTLGEQHRNTVNSMISLANTLAENGKLEEAEETLREAHRAQETVEGGWTRPDTFNTKMHLGIVLRAKGELDGAASLFRDCIQAQEFFLGKEHRDTVRSRMNLVLTFLEKGELDDARDTLRQCLEIERPQLGGERPDYYDVPSMMFANSDLRDDPDKAKARFEEIVKWRQRVLGEEHPDTLRARMMLGIALLKKGEPQRAEEAWRECLQVQRRAMGEEHPHTLSSMMNLAVRLERTGRTGEAEAMHRRIEEIYERVFAQQNPETLHIHIICTANRLADVGLFDEAEGQQRRILGICRRLLGEEHQRTLEATSDLALTLARKGNHDQADGMLRQCLEVQRRVLGEEHRDTLASMGKLGIALRQAGKLDEAEETLGRCLQTQLRVLGEKDRDTYVVKNNLGFLHREREKQIGAEKAQRQEVEFWRRLLGEEHEETLSAMSSLAGTLAKRDEFDEAEAILRRCVDIGRRVSGDEDLNTTNARNKLARLLKKRGKLDEAEVIVRHLLTVLERFRDKGDFNILRAMRRVAEVLEQKGDLDQAEAMLRKSLKIAREAHVRDREMLEPLDELASFLERRGKLQELETIFRERLRILEQVRGDEHSETLKAMNKLANLLWKNGELEEVEALNRRNLEIRQRVHGKEHPDAIWAMANLAVVLKEQGKLEEADTLNKERLEVQQQAREKTRAETEANSKLGTEARYVAASELLPAELLAKAGDAVATVTPAQDDASLLAHDDFDGKVSLDWKILNPDLPHLSLTKNPGSLTITTQGGGFYRSNTDYENLFLIDCPQPAGEGVELTTCVSSFTPVANWNQAGLIFYSDDDNYLKFVYEWEDATGGRIFTIGAETEGDFRTGKFRVHDQFDRVWLRVTKRTNRYTFSTSLDGQTFTPQVSPALDRTGRFNRGLVWGDGLVKRVGIIAKNGPTQGAPEVDASFDFFEVRAIPAEAYHAQKDDSAGGKGTNGQARRQGNGAWME